MANLRRFREYGFRLGLLLPGRRNSIADVARVTVGHTTVIRGKDIRTGITIIDPGVPELFDRKLPAAIAVGNGFGKLVGYTQVEEMGTLETPIALTNTLAVGAVLRGLVNLVLRRDRVRPPQTVNAVVGETNDGLLNDVHRDVVRPADVLSAYRNRRANFALGAVGAGTGTRAFAWKGGIGTASRVVTLRGKRYTLGALVQTNFGGVLTMLGVPVGEALGRTDFRVELPTGDGSCMIVLATDAPVTARQLKRVARRAFLGLARTGSVLASGSGDYAIAFSTKRTGLEGSGSVGRCLADEDLTEFFLAAVEAVEESVYDALFLARDMRGRGGAVLRALPRTEVVDLLRRHGYP